MPKARITLDVDQDTLQWYEDFVQAQKKAGRKISRNELVRKAMEDLKNRIILNDYKLDDLMTKEHNK